MGKKEKKLELLVPLFGSTFFRPKWVENWSKKCELVQKILFSFITTFVLKKRKEEKERKERNRKRKIERKLNFSFLFMFFFVFY